MAAVVLVTMTACGPLLPGTTYLHADDPLGPYSAAVLTSDFCFISGKIGDRTGTFQHEVETAIDAVKNQLAKAGLKMSQVVNVTIYMTDLDDYQILNQIYAARFPTPHPARVVVGVQRLPGDARVEIAAIARRW